jgi:hypothetical protein
MGEIEACRSTAEHRPRRVEPSVGRFINDERLTSGLRHALAQLSTPLVEQRRFRAWMRAVDDRLRGTDGFQRELPHRLARFA